MPSTLALPPVCAAVIAKLQGDTAITAIVPSARIDDVVPQRPAYPYISVEGAGEVPFNTMGAATAAKWGGVAGVQVRVVSQYRGESEVANLLSLVKARLDGQPLTVVGYPTAIVEYTSMQPLIVDLGGTITREWIAFFDITAHQS